MLSTTSRAISQVFVFSNFRGGASRSIHSFTSKKIGPNNNQFVQTTFRTTSLKAPTGASRAIFPRLFSSSFPKKSAEEGKNIMKETAISIQETYSTSLSVLHWLGAVGFIGCAVSGYVATTIPWDKKKTTPEKFKFKLDLMHYHKSVGLLMLALMVPRLAVRFTTKLPAALPGPKWEKWAGEASHLALYGCMVFMPVSGVVFGYLGGKGLPFFWTKIEGAPKETVKEYGAVTKFFFQQHKNVGQVLEYLIPLHVSASIFHYLFRGHNLLKRMNPFVRSA